MRQSGVNPGATVDPNQPQQQPAQNQLPTMLKPADGYILVSLKCNTPATGAAIPGEQLPALIDSAGAVHHPCGLIAGGSVEGKMIFEVDYCSIAGQITIGGDGAVSKPFPDELWLMGGPEYVPALRSLYGQDEHDIVSVKPFGAQAGTIGRDRGSSGLLIQRICSPPPGSIQVRMFPVSVGLLGLSGADEQFFEVQLHQVFKVVL